MTKIAQKRHLYVYKLNLTLPTRWKEMLWFKLRRQLTLLSLNLVSTTQRKIVQP